MEYKLRLGREHLKRLKSYIDSLNNSLPENVSNHWEKYSKKNTIQFSSDSVLLRGEVGSGFDSNYIGNFTQNRSLFQQIKAKIFKLMGLQHSDNIPLEAFEKTWGKTGKFSTFDIIRLENKPFNKTKCMAYNYFNEIYPYIEKSKVKLAIAEIGAGSGNFSSLLKKNFNACIYIIDLPNILVYSAMNLIHQISGMSYLLPNEIDSPISPGRYDYVFLRPDQLDLIPDNCLDVGINTASFGEMLMPNIVTYFDFFRRTLKQDNIFYCVNRVEKWMNPMGIPTSANVSGSAIPIRFHEYPWRIEDKDKLFHISKYHQFFTKQPLFSKITRMRVNENN